MSIKLNLIKNSLNIVSNKGSKQGSSIFEDLQLLLHASKSHKDLGMLHVLADDSLKFPNINYDSGSADDFFEAL
jgi:hypothetical protein